MTGELLLSKDGEPHRQLGRPLSPAPSPTGGNLSPATEARDLLLRFDPGTVGFGIIVPSSSHFSEMRKLTDTPQGLHAASGDGKEAG
jgi:hypothetical protein